MYNKVEIDSFVGSLPYFDWKTESWLKQKMKGVQRKIGCQWIHNLPSVKDKSKPDKVNCAELSEKRGEKLNCEVVQASWFRVRVWHPTFISAVWHFRPYKPYISGDDNDQDKDIQKDKDKDNSEMRCHVVWQHTTQM